MATGVKRRRRYNSPLRAEQADGTRRRVLAAARELFLARGYAGTTVAAVAQAAGVSPDTIYVSLGGKQGLLEGVLSLARSTRRIPRSATRSTRDEIGGSPTPTSGSADSSSSAARPSPGSARCTP